MHGCMSFFFRFILIFQAQELNDLRAVVSHLQEQQVQLQSKFERQKCLQESLHESTVSMLEDKCRKKDCLITVLADEIRMRVRNGYLGAIVETISSVRTKNNIQDFDNAKLCSYLSQADRRLISESQVIICVSFSSYTVLA